MSHHVWWNFLYSAGWLYLSILSQNSSKEILPSLLVSNFSMWYLIPSSSSFRPAFAKVLTKRSLSSAQSMKPEPSLSYSLKVDSQIYLDILQQYLLQSARSGDVQTGGGLLWACLINRRSPWAVPVGFDSDCRQLSAPGRSYFIIVINLDRDRMTNNFHYLFKYIIIGDPSVGKSCLLLQFTENRFASNYQATLGVEFGSKTFSYKGKLIKAMVWDTAGQETFKSIIRSYYRGAIIALVVYDITNRASYLNLQKWLDEIREHSHEYIQVILIGNKTDLEEKREVTYQEGRAFAQQKGYMFLEVSAKQNKFVDEAFERPAQVIVQKIESKQLVITPGLNIGIKVGNPGADVVQQHVERKPSLAQRKARKQNDDCSC